MPGRRLAPTGYVPRKEVQPYFTMAEQYAFADRMFETNSRAEFSGAPIPLERHVHDLPRARTLRAAENPITRQPKFTGGCDSPPGSLVTLIDPNGTRAQRDYPCFERPALTDLIDAKSLDLALLPVGSGLGALERARRDPPHTTGSQFATDVVEPTVGRSSPIFRWEIWRLSCG